MKKIKICGVPYKIKEVDVIDESTEGVTLGQIIGSKGIILIKKNQPKEIKKSTLFHEVFHGILTSLGYDELSSNETFVQSVSIAMYQMFDFKKGASK